MHKDLCGAFAMRVRVRVRDHTLEINVGEGSQRLKWLAVISLQRYEETIGEDSGEKAFSSAHVATGIMDAAGTLLPPNKSIRVALEDMQEVFVLVQADDDPKGASSSSTSSSTSSSITTTSSSTTTTILTSSTSSTTTTASTSSATTTTSFSFTTTTPSPLCLQERTPRARAALPSF